MINPLRHSALLIRAAQLLSAAAGRELTPSTNFAKFAPMIWSNLALVLCLIFFNSTAQAMGRSHHPKALLMGVMGDSISAGSFADFPLRPFAQRQSRIANSKDGDFNTQFVYQNRRKLCWASGKSILSHFRMLEAFLNAHGETQKLQHANVASLGNRTRDLPLQAQKIFDLYQSGEYSSLIYVTILIGSTDACNHDRPTPMGDMRRELLRAFAKLAEIEQDEPIRILLVGIPRIPDLGLPEIRKIHTPLFGLRCSTVRDHFMNLCPGLLRWRTQSEYNAALEIVEERNRLLKAVTAEANAAFPNLEIVFTDRLFYREIPPSMLATDCFHPNKYGQETISRELWQDQPWFWD